MGLETPKTPKRPKVKSEFSKTTKVRLGEERSGDVRQVEAKQKNAEEVNKKIDEIADLQAEDKAADDLDKTLAKLPAGKKAEAKPNVAAGAPKITKTFGMGEAPAPKIKVKVPKFTKVEFGPKRKTAKKTVAKLPGEKKVETKKPAVAEKPKKRGGA